MEDLDGKPHEKQSGEIDVSFLCDLPHLSDARVSRHSDKVPPTGAKAITDSPLVACVFIHYEDLVNDF